jgi:hypothetical protein
MFIWHFDCLCVNGYKVYSSAPVICNYENIKQHTLKHTTKLRNEADWLWHFLYTIYNGYDVMALDVMIRT